MIYLLLDITSKLNRNTIVNVSFPFPSQRAFNTDGVGMLRTHIVNDARYSMFQNYTHIEWIPHYLYP